MSVGERARVRMVVGEGVGVSEGVNGGVRGRESIEKDDPRIE